MEENLIPHSYKITKENRQSLIGQKSILIFFTGLSGSGKSTLANALECKLFSNGIYTYVLDGDNIRRGLNRNLTFTPEDRSENIRRIGEISKLFLDAGIVTLAAFVAPYEKDREFIRETVGDENFFEVFVDTSLKVCESRDVKGLYKKARAGIIKNLTGVNAPYQAPSNPDIRITEELDVEEGINTIYTEIINRIKPYE